MTNRQLGLSPRLENTKDIKSVSLPVQFDLEEIKQHFNESIESIKKQFDIADALIQDGKAIESKTIYRSQIVFLESILDFYLHEMTKYGLYQIYLGSWKKTDRYKNLKISMLDLEKAETDTSKKWFFSYVNETFACVVMQDWETIRDQLNTIGIMWKDVCIKLHPEMDEKHAITATKTMLSALYKRRNEIAHQNDRNHASAEQNDICKEFVESNIKNIVDFVNSIHDLAISQ